MKKQDKRQNFSLEEIAKFYPLLYSQKRLDEWLSLFDKRAMIVRVEYGQPVSCLNIIEGMPEQRTYAAENEFFFEEWHDVEIREYGNIAMLVANYILTTDHEIRKGVDMLTLCRDDRGWLITNLTYEQKEFIEL
jgi:hypothetical protein